MDPFTVLWLCLSLSIRAALSASVNRTIDDKNGDSVTGVVPIYSPDGFWTEGDTCVGCRVNSTIADVSKAFDRTWHDSTYHPGDPDHVISMTFTGTAVYAFTLLANQIAWVTTLTNLSFHIDGDLSGTYIHPPDSTTDMEYQVMVFSKTGLSNSSHTFEIHAGGSNASLILFDYVMYTVDEPDPPPSSSTISATTTPSATNTPPSSSVPSSSTHPQSPSSQSGASSIDISPSISGSPASQAAQPSPTGASSTSPATIAVSASPSNSPGPQSNESSPSATSLSSTDKASIIGGVVGSVLLIVIAVFSFRYLRRRRLIPSPAAPLIDEDTNAGSEYTHSNSSFLSRRALLLSHRPPPPPSETVTLLMDQIETLEAQMRALGSNNSEYPSEKSDRPSFRLPTRSPTSASWLSRSGAHPHTHTHTSSRYASTAPPSAWGRSTVDGATLTSYFSVDTEGSAELNALREEVAALRRELVRAQRPAEAPPVYS